MLTQIGVPFMYGLQHSRDMIVVRGDTLHWVRSLGMDFIQDTFKKNNMSEQRQRQEHFFLCTNSVLHCNPRCMFIFILLSP